MPAVYVHNYNTFSQLFVVLLGSEHVYSRLNYQMYPLNFDGRVCIVLKFLKGFNQVNQVAPL